MTVNPSRSTLSPRFSTTFVTGCAAPAGPTRSTARGGIMA